MRNSDKVSFVCFTTGGSRENGKTIGTKIRFTNDKLRYVKALGKLGVTETAWVQLPNPMTKVEAIQYVQNINDTNITSKVAYQDAIRNAASRLVPAVKAPKTSKNKK